MVLDETSPQELFLPSSVARELKILKNSIHRGSPKKELQSKFEILFSKLDARTKNLLTDYYLMDKKPSEIAAKNNLTLKYTRTLITRGRKEVEALKVEVE